MRHFIYLEFFFRRQLLDPGIWELLNELDLIKRTVFGDGYDRSDDENRILSNISNCLHIPLIGEFTELLHQIKRNKENFEFDISLAEDSHTAMDAMKLLLLHSHYHIDFSINTSVFSKPGELSSNQNLIVNSSCPHEVSEIL